MTNIAQAEITALQAWIEGIVDERVDARLMQAGSWIIRTITFDTVGSAPTTGPVLSPQFTVDTDMLYLVQSAMILRCETPPSGGPWSVGLDYQLQGTGAWTDNTPTEGTVAAGQQNGGGDAVYTKLFFKRGDVLRINHSAVNGVSGCTVQIPAVCKIPLEQIAQLHHGAGRAGGIA